MTSGVERGIAIGLWILAGLAFLLAAFFPGSFGRGILGPSIGALAIAWTALLPSTPFPLRRSERRSIVLVLLGGFLAFGIALFVIRDGDRRSFLYVAFTAVAALALASLPPPRGRADNNTSALRLRRAEYPPSLYRKEH